MKKKTPYLILRKILIVAIFSVQAFLFYTLGVNKAERLLERDIIDFNKVWFGWREDLAERRLEAHEAEAEINK